MISDGLVARGDGFLSRLWFLLVALMAWAAPASAQTPVILEKTVVTGSHIRGLDLEGATPVAVIDRQQIERSALSTVADVLRQSPWNTFGSFRELSGNTGQSQAQVSLRGLGAERTLVLLDGRRLPASPVVDGEAVDLNIVPLAAVERIEILKDGASAIYGSEAIGGVVNIILRKTYQGTELAGMLERPTPEKGGDADNLSLVHGGRYSRGNYLFSLEYHRKEIIWSRDRWWSRKELGDGVNFETTRGLSVLGNTAWPYSTGLYTPYKNRCDPSVFAGVFDHPDGGRVCAYAYADVAGETNDLERGSGLLSLDYELDERNKVYFRTLLSRVRSFGRFAPAAGWLSVTDPYYGAADLGLRFYTFGPRNDTMVNWQLDSLMGLRGLMGGGIDYDLFLRYNRYKADYTGENYILADAAIAAIESGSYDPADPLATPPPVLEGMRTRIGRDMHTNYLDAGINLSGQASVELAGGNVSWAAGLEYRDEDFADIYDENSQAENVIGTAGSSAEGSRRQWALYGETVFPVMENLELIAALRHDQYNDVGGATSPQLKARWQPRRSLVVRASWGKGFRAPSMSDLYTAPGWGVEVVRDCPPPYSCPAEEAWVLAGGNPELDPERSESWNLGFAWGPLEGLHLTLDYYDITVRDAIQTYSAQALLNLQHQGKPLPQGTAIIRDSSGFISEIHSTFSNVSRLRTRGLDLGGRYGIDLGASGMLEARLNWVHVLEYHYQVAPELQGQDYAGTYSAEVGAAPDDRAQLGLHWGYREFGISWLVDYIDRMKAEPRDIASWTSHTLTLTWDTPWKGRLGAGARNLFNRDPPIELAVDADYTHFYDLYPIEGRVLFVNYTQQFD